MLNTTKTEDLLQEEHIILEAISEVKMELSILRERGSKGEQIECFKRLITLYGALNIDRLIKISGEGK